MHEVMDADEQEPLPTAQAADQRVLNAAALQLVALDPCRRLADGAAGFVEELEQPLARGIRGPGTDGVIVGD
jgi:hypothetical protein